LENGAFVSNWGNTLDFGIVNESHHLLAGGEFLLGKVYSISIPYP
jgi:hypothetical protein